MESDVPVCAASADAEPPTGSPARYPRNGPLASLANLVFVDGAQSSQTRLHTAKGNAIQKDSNDPRQWRFAEISSHSDSSSRALILFVNMPYAVDARASCFNYSARSFVDDDSNRQFFGGEATVEFCAFLSSFLPADINDHLLLPDAEQKGDDVRKLSF